MESMLGKIKSEYSLYTKEVLAEIGSSKKSLFIGIPKETDYQEKRIPLTPNSVAALVNYGFRITIEKDAGESSNFSNDEYMNAGADVVFTKDDVFKADTILKSGPINAGEISLLHSNQIIFSPILLPNQTKKHDKKHDGKTHHCYSFRICKRRLRHLSVYAQHERNCRKLCHYDCRSLPE
jgi:alanine dehydrogenase